MAKQRGLIALAKPVFERLHRSDFRISAEVISVVLRSGFCSVLLRKRLFSRMDSWVRAAILMCFSSGKLSQKAGRGVVR